MNKKMLLIVLSSALTINLFAEETEKKGTHIAFSRGYGASFVASLMSSLDKGKSSFVFTITPTFNTMPSLIAPLEKGSSVALNCGDKSFDVIPGDLPNSCFIKRTS